MSNARRSGFITGGKATINYRRRGSTEEHSFVFYIRGTNPTHADVEDEACPNNNCDPWFLKKLIHQESSFRQFHDDNPGTAWIDIGKTPL